MCSTPINGRTSTHIPPPPVHTSSCQTALWSKDLRESIFKFLPVSDMHTVQNISKALQAPILLKSSDLDLREKVLDFQTLVRICAEHSPRALRVKLSENWRCEDLIERCKKLPPILSLDLTECPDISIESLIQASKELSALEEIHLKDHEKHLLSLNALLALGKQFSLRAIHIQSEKDGLLYSVIQNSTQDEFADLQILPIKSIDMRRVHLPMSLGDPFLKQRLSDLPFLETLSLPTIYEDETDKMRLISGEHMAPFTKGPIKHLTFSSGLDDTALDALGKCASLESLSFSDDTIFNDGRLSALKGLRLKKLHIDNAKELTEKGLASVRHFPLVQLSLNQLKTSADMLKIIADFKHLGMLRLAGCVLLSAGIDHLRSLQRLKVLDLTGAYVYGKIRLDHPLEKLILKEAKLFYTFKPFYSFFTIEEVKSSEIYISSSDGRVIQSLLPLKNTNLRKLSAHNVTFNDYALLSLPILSDLTELTFGITNSISSQAHKSLQTLRLQHLTLVDSRLDDPLLRSIAKISTLRTLSFKDIIHSTITENGFIQLKQLHNLTSISSNQILNYFVSIKKLIKLLFSDAWFYKIFKNIACLRIQYPAAVHISSDDINIHTTVTRLGDLPNHTDRIQAFFVQNIRQQFRFKTQYINAIEHRRSHVVHPGTMHTFVPQFEPTIIQAWCQVPRSQPLFLQGTGPELSKLRAVPMTFVGDNKWKAVLNTPIQSYRLFKGRQVDERGWQEVGDWGFGCTHDTHPVFASDKRLPSFIVVRAHCTIPERHIPYLETYSISSRVPMVEIAPNLWEARVGVCTQYKVFLDGIHEEIGERHRVDVESDTNVCSPVFKPHLKHGPIAPLTTVLVQYSAPAGHSMFLRSLKESFPMVPIGERLWETHFTLRPNLLQVTLDNLVVAEGGPFVPKAGSLTKITPTFACDKVLIGPYPRRYGI